MNLFTLPPQAVLDLYTIDQYEVASFWIRSKVLKFAYLFVYFFAFNLFDWDSSH